MDFRLGDASERFREEVRAFLAEHVTDELRERVHRTGTYHDWALHRAIAERGWLAAAWPEELGGQGRDPLEMTALAEEMVLADAPVDGMNTTMLIASIVRLEGSEDLRREVIPRVLAGEILMCLGYSEPDAGSDMANAKTRAERDGDQWVVNGQKMWTSLAHESAFVLLLTRSNPDAPKHKGLTLFLVPMDTAGIEVQPIETLGGQRTNITFYTDVRVADRFRVGEVDDGWGVMRRTALSLERGGKGRGLADCLLADAVTWAESTTRAGRPAIEDRSVRETLADIAIRNEVAMLLGYRAAWLSAQGGTPGVAGSMGKLFQSESYVRAAADMIDLAAPDGILEARSPGAPCDGRIEYHHRKAAVTTIYQGTSEIQRSIIAEQHLGLPRSR